MFANQRFEILNRNQLKYLVIIFMLFDHMAYFLPEDGSIRFFISVIGFLTAPTMALFIAEGYHYTRDVKKYMRRLLIFSIISYFPYILFFAGQIMPIQLFPGQDLILFYYPSGESFIEPEIFIAFLNSTLVVLETSVIFTLLLGLFTIYLWDKLNLPTYVKVVITLFILWISAFCCWYYFLILLCLVFYFFRDNPKRLWMAYAVVFLLSLFSVRLFLNPFYPTLTMDFYNGALGMLLVPLLFALYNGKPGTKSWMNKWFFYIFYPGHLLILAAIRFLI